MRTDEKSFRRFLTGVSIAIVTLFAGMAAASAADAGPPLASSPACTTSVAALGLELDLAGVELTCRDRDEVAELAELVAKKPPKGDPCDECSETFGSCTRFSCSPCCYTCPDLPWILCIEF